MLLSCTLTTSPLATATTLVPTAQRKSRAWYVLACAKCVSSPPAPCVHRYEAEDGDGCDDNGDADGGDA